MLVSIFFFGGGLVSINLLSFATHSSAVMLGGGMFNSSPCHGSTSMNLNPSDFEVLIEEARGFRMFLARSPVLGRLEACGEGELIKGNTTYDLSQSSGVPWVGGEGAVGDSPI